MRGKHGNHARGPKAGRWNSGKITNADGYVKLRVGKAHPLADPNGYAYEHLVVWVAAGNRRPARGFVLHHINGVKSDNRIENLEQLSRGQHNSEHLAERDRCVVTGQLLPCQQERTP